MIGGLLKVMIFSLMLVVPNMTNHKMTAKTSVPDNLTVPELTLDNVYRELLYMDVKFADIVLKQVVYETMWLKCKHCSLKFNNLFGFTTRKGYMKFKTWVDCIKFYKQWQDRLDMKEDANYYTVLKRARFAVYQDYTLRLRSIPVKHITEKFEMLQAKPQPLGDAVARNDK